MIQRIQSLFLLAAAIISGLLLTGNLMVMNDIFSNSYVLNFFSLTVNMENHSQVQKLLPLSIILVSVPVMCLVSIFIYKNRKLQMKVTMVSLLLAIGSFLLAALYIIMLGKKIELTYVWQIKAAFPILTAILCWLAYRSIQKDEEKVRSLDRLR